MKWSWGWVLNWTIVFLFNLPVTIILGLESTKGLGCVGMFSAIPVLWFLGIPLVMFPGRFRVALCTGGVLLAFSQILPIIQLASGTIAIGSLEIVTGQNYRLRQMESIAISFLATVITGQCLAFASVIIGYPLSWFFSIHDPVGVKEEETSPPNPANGATAGDPIPE